MVQTLQRKVSKYNVIHYETTTYTIPSGYVGLTVNLLIFENKMDIYYHDQCLISHSLQSDKSLYLKKKVTRSIYQVGTIGYKGHYYSIDYKLRGTRVDVQESNDGLQLLIYWQDKLIKTLSIID